MEQSDSLSPENAALSRPRGWLWLIGCLASLGILLIVTNVTTSKPLTSRFQFQRLAKAEFYKEYLISDSGTGDSHVTFVANEYDFSVETALNHVRHELQPQGWGDVTTWDDRPARRFTKPGSNLTVEVRPSRIGSEILLDEQIPATMGNRMRVWFRSLTESD